MELDFRHGILIGIIVTWAVMMLIRGSYRKTLLLKAGAHPTAEKLPDGKFYYIVEEKKYSELERLALAVRGQQPIGYITTDCVHVMRQQTRRSDTDQRIWHPKGRAHRATVPVYLQINTHYDGS